MMHSRMYVNEQYDLPPTFVHLHAYVGKHILAVRLMSGTTVISSTPFMSLESLVDNIYGEHRRLLRDGFTVSRDFDEFFLDVMDMVLL